MSRAVGCILAVLSLIGVAGILFGLLVLFVGSPR